MRRASREEREEGEKKQKDEREEMKMADMWASLPRAIHVSETTFQNSLTIKYE